MEPLEKNASDHQEPGQCLMLMETASHLLLQVKRDKASNAI